MSITTSKTWLDTTINGMTVQHSIPCSSGNYTACSSRTIKYICLHYTSNANDKAKSNCNYFASSGRRASAHFFVDDNSIWQSVRLKDRAWHVGTTGKYYDPDCRNSNSVGIEMCGGNHAIVTEKTKKNAAHLAAYLCRLMGISADQVDDRLRRHWDITRKECPLQMIGSSNTEWKNFKKDVKNILRGQATASVSAKLNTTEAVNIRLVSGKANPVVGEFTKDTSVSASVIESTTNWNKISVWVAKKQCPDYVTNSEANIRMKSGKANPVVGKFVEGINIKDSIKSQTDNWYEVFVWVPKKLFR